MRFNYTDYNGHTGFCDITVKNNVVIATELKENTGASITNCAEQIATSVCKANNIEPENLVWIEHYKPSIMTKKDTYDSVTFDIDYANGRFWNARWKRIFDIDAFLEQNGVKTTKKTAKKQNTELEYIQNNSLVLPEITFISEAEFMQGHRVMYDELDGIAVDGKAYYKVGNFRCDFENEIGHMWVKWFPGNAAELLDRPALKAEVESIMATLKLKAFKNYKIFLNYFAKIAGNGTEAILIGIGKQGIYRLLLRPMKGDYNTYLFCYSA